MTVEYFLNENTLVIMAHNNEKEGLTFLGAQMSKAEFEKSHPPNGLHAEIEPGVLCPDVKGRKGYCVIFKTLPSQKNCRF